MPFPDQKRREAAPQIAWAAALQARRLKPDHFDRYALSPADDAKLTQWRHEHLTIAVWAIHGDPDPLAEIEKRILKTWNPPLNLTHIAPTRLTALVKSARNTMASEARAL